MRQMLTRWSDLARGVSPTGGSSSRHELYQCTPRKRQIGVDSDNYELHARTYDSCGEQAYRVRLRRA